MARMSLERETVISIRHEVNRHTKIKLAQARTNADQSLPPTSSIGTQSSCVVLGSWDEYRDVQGHEEEVMEEFGFVDFGEKLATFLQRFKFDVHGEDFNPYAGHRIHIKRMRVC